MLFAAANRDERVFPNPGVVDPTRDPNPHMAFGFGIHFCLGASLARTELRVGIGEFLNRFPEYRVQYDMSTRQASDTNRGFSSLSVVC
jgi:cytochrome P450